MLGITSLHFQLKMKWL